MDDRRDFDRRYFEIVRAWLEMRFRERDESGCFKAHEPVYGLGRGHTEGHHCRRAIRLHDLLATVKWLGVEGSLLDVGAAEGYFPHLARTALGLDAWASDLSREACLRAAELFGLPAVPANAGALPFPDDAFDVVTIAEVIEHVADPVGTLLELQRVARRFVVFSTEEWREDEALRDHILGARRLENHMERNIYAPSDLPVLFGGSPRVRWAQRFPVDGPEIADEVFDEAAFGRLLDGRPPSVEGGTIVVVAVGPDPIPEGRPSLHEPAIAAAIARNVSTPESRLEVARGAILERIACPLCGGRLTPEPGALICPTDGFRAPDDGRLPDPVHFEPGPDNVPRVAARLGLPESRARAAAALDERFALVPSGATAWTGSEIAADDSGWSVQGLTPDADGALVAEDADPRLVSPYLGVRMDGLEGVRVKMSVGGGREQAWCELFYLLEGRYLFEQELSAGGMFHFAPGEPIEVVVPFPEAVRAAGRFLVRLRLDPVAGDPGAPVTIDSVALV